MPETMHLRARVAALARAGNAPALREARRDLAAANIRRAIDRQRAAIDLPPVSDDLAAALAIFLLR
jgi:hypothetical protein